MFPRTRPLLPEKWAKLFEKTDANRSEDSTTQAHAADEWEYRYVLYRAADLQLAQRAYEAETLPLMADSPRRGLAGLGTHKPLHELVGSGLVWVKAFDVLKVADEIYIVGWSASPYDAMARFHFASVLDLRETQPSLVVVDPKVCKQNANYKAIFKDVEPIGQYAERVDWDSLLGRS